MTCWVKLPTPALPGSGSRRPETAVCFDLSRGCPSAPLFLCPNLLYTPTADCQAFQILSTRFPPGFTRFLQCSFICTGYTAAILKNTQTGVIDRKKKRILCGAMAAAMTVSGYSATVDDSGADVSDSFSMHLRNPEAFPRGGRWPRRAG